MSVDPIIQSVGNSQSINPYSYIMNNPLSGTDPTGYTAECNDSGVCDIGNIKMDDVENVQVTKDGNMVVNTKDGNSYQVESINGADAKGAFTSAYNVGKSPDIMSQSNINKSSPTPSGEQSSGGCGGALSASVAICGVLPPPPVAGMSDVTGQADRNKRMAEGLTDLSNDLAEQKKLVLKAVQMALTEFRRPNSEVLKNTLAKAGMQKPDGNWDAHHIVFWGHSHVDSKAARDLLEEFGIDINSADNLVWLPRTQHDKRQLGVPHLAHHGDGIHTYRAISSVNQRLNMAVDKNHARAILRSIRNDLERGHKFWETQ
ncbi:AHH domain-containing protein [Pseudoalteromonas sp. JSTW]|uniref:AHH domain-containing protein n=1 Tax=Pseudoalteromonas sp. JSTW TaxID=2752475 RepID=UPI0035A73871